MTLHLDPEHLARVHAILAKHAADLEVWAFGSRVTGRRLKPFSDLDLLLRTAAPWPVARMARLREAFSGSDLPFKVDLLDQAAIDEGFRSIIEREHLVLQRAGASTPDA